METVLSELKPGDKFKFVDNGFVYTKIFIKKGSDILSYMRNFTVYSLVDDYDVILVERYK